MKWNVFLGDSRMNYLCDMLKNEKIEKQNVSIAEVLPIPVTRDGQYITTSKILIKDFFENLSNNSIVFCGKKDSIPQGTKIKNKIYDYSSNEFFLMKNAELTAQGTIKFLYENSDKPLNYSKILIAGFGRIGKNLTKFLTGLESKVYVLGNKEQDFFWIKKIGANAVKSPEDLDISPDFVINTVPYIIFNEQNIKKFNKDTIFVELASKPGIDKNLCKNFKYILLPGIPGKFFPKYAAEIIKKSIINIINSGV